MAGFRSLTRQIFKTAAFNQTNPLEIFHCGRTTCLEKTNFRTGSVIDKKFYGHTYEGEGKTVAYVLSDKRLDTVCIKSVSIDGFTLHNGMEIVGSAIVFPFAIFSWNVQSLSDVNEESLTLFKVLEPKIDLLIFGYGRYEEFTLEQRDKFHKLFKKMGIKYEALPTEQAIGTYNFLSDEFRYVAAAIIPPSVIDTLKLEKTLSDIKLLQIEDEDEEEMLKLEIKPKDDKKLIK